MQIDNNAPFVGKKEILINAPIVVVWKIQSDINNWPKWQKDVSFAKLEGDLQKGTSFRWKAMGMGITSTLQNVIPNKIISWTGNSIGMKAIHIWKFEKQGNKTKVITEESLSGWFPRILKIFKKDFLDESLTKALETLKIEAERQVK